MGRPGMLFIKNGQRAIVYTDEKRVSDKTVLWLTDENNDPVMDEKNNPKKVISSGSGWEHIGFVD